MHPSCRPSVAYLPCGGEIIAGNPLPPLLYHAACIARRCSTRCACCRREMITGKPLPLLSSFKLSYYTLLNLLRRSGNSDHDMEYVVLNSFQQFQFERSLPQLAERLEAVEKEADAIEGGSREAMAEYATLRQVQKHTRTKINANFFDEETQGWALITPTCPFCNERPNGDA
jgi:rRNA-processing arch domain